MRYFQKELNGGYFQWFPVPSLERDQWRADKCLTGTLRKKKQNKTKSWLVVFAKFLGINTSTMTNLAGSSTQLRIILVFLCQGQSYLTHVMKIYLWSIKIHQNDLLSHANTNVTYLNSPLAMWCLSYTLSPLPHLLIWSLFLFLL